MPSYDLTEDNRGLTLDGRLINTELVSIRNILWLKYVQAFDGMSRAEAQLALNMYNICQDELNK